MFLMQVSFWWQVACRTDIVGKSFHQSNLPNFLPEVFQSSITFHTNFLFCFLPFAFTLFPLLPFYPFPLSEAFISALASNQYHPIL